MLPWFLPKKGSPLTAINSRSIVKNELQLFPNPATDMLTVKLQGTYKGNDYLQVYTILGELILEKELNYTSTIDVSTLAAGCYFVRSKNQAGLSRSFIKH